MRSQLKNIWAVRLSVTSVQGGYGLGGKLDGKLIPGEFVLMELSDSQLVERLQPCAQVRYRKDDFYGFEFRELGALEKAALRRSCEKFAAA